MCILYIMLTSDDSKFMTIIIINVNGGLVL